MRNALEHLPRKGNPRPARVAAEDAWHGNSGLRDFTEHDGLHLEMIVALGAVFDAEKGGISSISAFQVR